MDNATIYWNITKQLHHSKLQQNTRFKHSSVMLSSSAYFYYISTTTLITDFTSQFWQWKSYYYLYFCFILFFRLSLQRIKSIVVISVYPGQDHRISHYKKINIDLLRLCFFPKSTVVRPYKCSFRGSQILRGLFSYQGGHRTFQKHIFNVVLLLLIPHLCLSLSFCPSCQYEPMATISLIYLYYPITSDRKGSAALKVLNSEILGMSQSSCQEWIYAYKPISRK